MNPFAVAPFGQDPWWLVLVKVVLPVCYTDLRADATSGEDE